MGAHAQRSVVEMARWGIQAWVLDPKETCVLVPRGKMNISEFSLWEDLLFMPSDPRAGGAIVLASLSTWSEHFSSGQLASGAPGVCSLWLCPVGRAACAPKSVIIRV